MEGALLIPASRDSGIRNAFVAMAEYTHFFRASREKLRIVLMVKVERLAVEGEVGMSFALPWPEYPPQHQSSVASARSR